MRTIRAIVWFTMLAVPRHGLHVQQLQQIVFGPPTASLAQGFTRLGGVRELDRTRAVIVDVADHSVFLADFVAGLATVIGRQGQGPEEYLRPIGLVGLPDHRILVQDAGNERLLELSPAGTVVGVWTATAAGGRPVLLPPRSVSSSIWGSDSRGRLYFEQAPKESGGGASAIVRLDLSATGARFDTAATLAVTEAMGAYTMVSQDNQQVNFRRRVWAPRWRWVVSDDGRIALVEPAPYRVSWVDGASRTAGPPVPFAPVKVVQADRDAYLESIGQPVRTSSGTGAGGGPFRKQEGTPEFPEVMPAFLGQDAIHAAPDGRLWVERAASLTDPVRTYDIFDGTGRLAARATAPSRRRVVGFGERAVYMVFRDADDVEHLERYSYPVP